MNQNVKVKSAWDLRKAGWSISKIANQLQIHDSTVKRYIKKHEEEVKPDPTDITVSRCKEFVDEAWEGLAKLMRAKSTPANVKKDIFFKILGSEGELVDKSKVEHTGEVNHNHHVEMKKQLQADTREGLSRFGVIIPNLSTDN